MSVNLWHKGVPLDPRIKAFTVGEDAHLDRTLLPWDLRGSAAHARMLGGIGVLSADETRRLLEALGALAAECAAGRFTVADGDEDCHTAIEAALTQRLGPLGGKIHLGRSRNDQVILALRLHQRSAALGLHADLERFAASMFEFIDCCASAPLAGQTHLQPGMPCTWGMWAHAFIEATLESMRATRFIYSQLNVSPLGSAAGFGSPVPVDREAVAESLGFRAAQRSVIDVIHSRSRLEGRLLSEICVAASVIEKFACDLSLFLTREYGYLRLDESFRTGSSIMPQKQNPDVVELLRARSARLRAVRDEHEWVSAKLPSNYHRDSQLLKGPVLRGIAEISEILGVAALLPSRLELQMDRIRAAMTGDLDAAREASERALEGVPFREAYRDVAGDLPSAGTSRGAPEHVLAESRSELEQARSECAEMAAWEHSVREALDRKLENVFTP